MDHLAPNTLATRLQAMGQILRGMDPARPTKSEKSVIRYAKEHANVVGSQRKQGRVVDSAILQSAGIRHFRAHRQRAGTDLDAAVHCRDGVMIALLAAMPMRRRPFVNLEMGRSLRHGPEGWRVCLDEVDLKAGTSWEASVPSSVHPFLEQYVETVRPLLASMPRHPSRLLWLTKEGRPIEAAYFGVRIKELTRRLIGRDISCHLFRDCAATTLALSSSDSARSIKALLGHASERTSTRHYIQATSIEAGRLLTASVAAIKGDK
jgi:site-specific recombinase XerD